MAGKLHENEMKEGQAGEKAQEKTGKKAGVFSRLKPALAALAITVGACGTYENEGIPAVSTDGTGGMSVDGGTTSDGGVEEDGGEGGDGGTGGKDAGSGGQDAGTGGHDAGTGGMDSGTGGLDAGTGGMDSGTGGMDSGTGGLDGGGGMDSGTGGDGGMGGMDSGTGGDGGTGGDAGVSCMGLGIGNFSGLVATGAGQVVGGYTFTYLGPSGGQAMLDISCSGGVLFNDYLFPEDMVTNVIDMPNGKQFNITPHSIGAGSTNITIQVANWP